MVTSCCSGEEVVITGGPGISVTGSGTAANKYVISAELPDFTEIIQVRDSPTVNLSLFGSGVRTDPFIFQAAASLSLSQLTDVRDPQGAAPGDTMVYKGVAGDGHWEFEPQQSGAAGAVNVGEGLRGTGAAGAPLAVSTSADAPAEPYSGLGIYLDPSGEIRAVQPTVTGVAWDSIAGRPLAFTPTAHKHVAADITDQQNINAGYVNGVKVYSQQAQPPIGPAGTLWASWA